MIPTLSNPSRNYKYFFLKTFSLACKVWFMDMTLKEMASLGGFARAKKLSKKRRIEIAKKASRAAKTSGKRLGRPRKNNPCK